MSADRRWSMLSFVVRSAPILIPAALIGAFLFGALSYLVTPTYTSVARFTVNTSQPTPSGSLAAIARQSGISLSQNGPEGSLDYWQQVVTGRSVRERVLNHGVEVPRKSGTQRIDLYTWYRIPKTHGDTSREQALSGLAENLSAGMDSRANILSLVANDRDPAVAAALAATTLDELNAFNIESRQSTARQNRVFIEDRLSAARAEASRAQQELTDFYANNRNFQGSPALVAYETRLRREAANKEELAQSLVVEYEQARIQEARDLPAITIIERPVPAIRRSAPNRVSLVILGFILGLFAGLLFTALREWRGAVRSDSERMRVVAAALNQTRLGRAFARRLLGTTSA